MRHLPLRLLLQLPLRVGSDALAGQLHQNDAKGEHGEGDPLHRREPPPEHQHRRHRRRHHLHLRRDRRGDRIEVAERIIPQEILQRVAGGRHGELDGVVRVLGEERSDALPRLRVAAAFIRQQRERRDQLEQLGQKDRYRWQKRGNERASVRRDQDERRILHDDQAEAKGARRRVAP